jgi:hypothetical protein
MAQRTVLVLMIIVGFQHHPNRVLIVVIVVMLIVAVGRRYSQGHSKCAQDDHGDSAEEPHVIDGACD